MKWCDVWFVETDVVNVDSLMMMEPLFLWHFNVVHVIPYYYIMMGFLTLYFVVLFLCGDCTLSTDTQVDEE
jgi:hypothetical protein